MCHNDRKTGLHNHCLFLPSFKGENGQNTVLGSAEVTGISGNASCLSGPYTTGEFKAPEGSLIGVRLELV
jgi:hypothetical protein